MKLTINLDIQPQIGDVLSDLEYSGTTVTCIKNELPYLFELEEVKNLEYLTSGTILYKVQSMPLNGSPSYPDKDIVQFKIL